jgi:hypothetical protein
LGRLFKLLVILAVLGAAALVGYAYLGDLEPAQSRVTDPVTLDLDGEG